MIVRQPPLLTVPMVGLMPVSMNEANQLLVDWGHKLGTVNRPFRQEAYTLDLHGDPIAVATSGSIVSATAAGFRRDEVVELTRLCSDPAHAWATRIMLRLWREVCAPSWGSWSVKAAVSYSHNTMHRGDMYRFDGWEKVADNCGSSGGGAWTRQRYATDAVMGKKSLWIWRYPTVSEEDRDRLDELANALAQYPDAIEEAV